MGQTMYGLNGGRDYRGSCVKTTRGSSFPANLGRETLCGLPRMGETLWGLKCIMPGEGKTPLSDEDWVDDHETSDFQD